MILTVRRTFNAKRRKSVEDNPIPAHQKLTLTIPEAAAYSNIGMNKISGLLRQPNCPFVLYVGNKKLVKREAFEDYIQRQLAI